MAAHHPIHRGGFEVVQIQAAPQMQLYRFDDAKISALHGMQRTNFMYSSYRMESYRALASASVRMPSVEPGCDREQTALAVPNSIADFRS